MKRNKIHFRKYFQIQERLIEHLKAGISAKKSAKDLRISLPTFYKYKNLASIEADTIYMTAEEKNCLEKLHLMAKMYGHPLSSGE